MQQQESLAAGVAMSLAGTIMGIEAIAKFYEKPVDCVCLDQIGDTVYARVVPVNRTDLLQWLRRRMFATYNLGWWKDGDLQMRGYKRRTFLQKIRYSPQDLLCVTIEQDVKTIGVSFYNPAKNYDL